ncbi:MAG: hypothetical protein Phog2KO_42290 [Phototrophicaceae bacterium]
MKRITRFMMLALTMSLVLSLAGISYAQDGDFCHNLSEDDCELYYELLENASLPSSTAFELATEFNMVIEENGNDPEEVEMAFDISGAYVIDEDAMEDAFEEFSDVDFLDASPRAFLDLFRGTLAGFDAELEIDYTFDDEMGIPPIGPFNVWMVDGVGYVDFTPFAMFDPSLTGVYGLNIFDLVEYPLDNLEMGDIFDALSDMGNDFDMSDFDEDTFSADNPDNPFANMMPAVLSEEDVATFVTVERADDDTVDGVDVVVFVTEIDLGAAMEVDAIIAQAYQSAIQADLPEDISEEDFAAALVEALAGSVITVTEKIDPETGITMQTSFDANIVLEIAPIAALTGDQEEGSAVFNMTMDFSRSDVNAVDAIELPENAEEIPVEALLGGF